MSKAGIVGKISLEGTLELLSPLLIGGGEGAGDIDCEVIKDGENRPYIPGTSFAGALRSHCLQRLRGELCEQSLLFWGKCGDEKKNDGRQSAVAVSDLNLKGYRLAVRDGVSIDDATGMAETGKKYDYEVVEPGAKAEFCLEITLRQGDDAAAFRQLAAFLLQELKMGAVSLGAMTAKGFGEVRLAECQSLYFDFARSQHVLAWLARDESGAEKLDLLSEKTQIPPSNRFAIEAWFSLQSSLIVRSYDVSSDSDDAVQLRSGGRMVIPGTSIKGALRARAREIGGSFGCADDSWLRAFMGYADDKNEGQEKIKSRLRVRECYFDKAEEIAQTRIRIDRFTGGVMNTALFSTRPVWRTGNLMKPAFALRFDVQEPEEWEAGLLLQLLKDLWTGWLPLGGEKAIGRGALQGVSATLSYGEQSWRLEQTETGLQIEGDKEKLEEFAAALAVKLAKEETHCER